ncbi:hypothetical protein ACFQ0B_00975 [Nonomuraea thailandensis]
MSAGPMRAVRRDRLPAGVYLLSLSLFAMGSAEFLLAGVLPAIAGDLRITLSSAGALISAFAAAVVVGGPPWPSRPCAGRGGRRWWPRRRPSPRAWWPAS